jgi:excisionase family DNA binding protein
MKQHKYLTVDELSDLLQVHRSTIYRLLRERKLPGFRVGSDWRFNVEEVERWLRSQTNSRGETEAEDPGSE